MQKHVGQGLASDSGHVRSTPSSISFKFPPNFNFSPWVLTHHNKICHVSCHLSDHWNNMVTSREMTHVTTLIVMEHGREITRCIKNTLEPKFRIIVIVIVISQPAPWPTTVSPSAVPIAGWGPTKPHPFARLNRIEHRDLPQAGPAVQHNQSQQVSDTLLRRIGGGRKWKIE